MAITRRLCVVFLCGVLASAFGQRDLALNKPAIQIDEGWEGPADLAVDGYPDTTYDNGHCTHTHAEANTNKKNWWAVDLGAVFSISSVSVTNRGDCCGDRLANFDIVVLNTRPVEGKQMVYTPGQVCAHKTGAVKQGGTETFQCHGEGQFVAVVQPRAQHLTLCQVQVHGVEADLALGKPAIQIDEGSRGVPSRAVDGNPDTNYPQGHCTHTMATTSRPTEKNWWAVDLQGMYYINSVSITNRGDCCETRLADFDVVVTNTRPVYGQQIQYTQGQVCAHKRGAMGKGGTETFQCYGVGQYVAVVQSRSRPLTLCEVRVYGEVADITTDIALRKRAFQVDTTSGGVATRAVDGVVDATYGNGHCTHTAAETPSNKVNWWAVDLQGPFYINSVSITNRGDCCGARLADFDIVVTDTAPVSGRQFTYRKDKVCHHRKGAVIQGGTETYPCFGYGRYVVIVQSRVRNLTLCSVKVFGNEDKA